MARTRSSGNGRLEESTIQLQQSMTMLLTQAQATFLARAAESDRILAEEGRRIDARFVQVEARLALVERGLAEVLRRMQALEEQMRSLTDEVRGKIGFKPSQP